MTILFNRLISLLLPSQTKNSYLERVVADHVTQVDMTPERAERLWPVTGDPLVDGRRAPVVVPFHHQPGSRSVCGVQIVVTVKDDAR